MLSTDPTSPLDHYESFVRPRLVREVIQDACNNILKRGNETHYSEIYERLFEYINDNLDYYIPEEIYDVE
jgi:hypothetical protein